MRKYLDCCAGTGGHNNDIWCEWGTHSINHFNRRKGFQSWSHSCHVSDTECVCNIEDIRPGNVRIDSHYNFIDDLMNASLTASSLVSVRISEWPRWPLSSQILISIEAFDRVWCFRSRSKYFKGIQNGTRRSCNEVDIKTSGYGRSLMFCRSLQ